MTSSDIVRRHWALLDGRESQVKGQLIMLALLLVTLAKVGLIEYFWPNFFNYPRLGFGITEAWRFWPLMLYGVVLQSALMPDVYSSYLDERLLGWGTITSVLAGVWEELGFRWLYICGGMIGVIVANWMYGHFLGWVLALVTGSVLVFALRAGLWKAVAWAAFGTAMATLLAVQGPDPLYWLYESVMIPFLSFVSFGSLDSVLYGYDKLFVMGAIAANAKFRDGHKYQGPIGMLNSWFIGFVLLYAALAYNLVTAIVVHAAYDVTISLTLYAHRKIRG